MRESRRGKLSAQLVPTLSSPFYPRLLKLRRAKLDLEKRASLLSTAKSSPWFTESPACSYSLPRTSGKSTPEKTQQLLLLWSRRWAKPRNPQQLLAHPSPPGMSSSPAGEAPSPLPPWASPHPGRAQWQQHKSPGNLRQHFQLKRHHQLLRDTPHTAASWRGWGDGRKRCQQHRRRGFGPQKPKCSWLSNAHPGTAPAERARGGS